MILHPGIIGLIVGAIISIFMLSYAALTGVAILRRWDFSSSSENQLKLERRTYLVSTVVHWALLFQGLSLLLFVYTMDDIHGHFIGAMCATGSLNANPVGWYALVVKIVTLFLSCLWLVLNSVDQRLENIPFVRFKYSLLLGIVPLVAIDSFFIFSYFLGLEPAMITSCCGSLFGSNSSSAVSTLAALPVRETMVFFYSYTVFYIVCVTCILFFQSRFLRAIVSILAGIYLILGLAAVISFISIYIYELPTHHCPFDILQANYNFIGYPLYLLLFISVFFGSLPGLFQPLKVSSETAVVLETVERRWVKWSLGGTAGLVALVTYAVISSNLNYFSG